MMDNIQYSYAFNSPSNQASLSSSIIITPYEKVLTILNNVKHYINSTSKRQTKLVRSLDWVIKVITSHSLYAYELKEKELINKLAKENSDFKNFVDFVSKYNEQVIEMNKKNIILGAKTIDIANDLLQKPSINLKKTLSKKNNTPIKKIHKIKLTKSCRTNEKEDNNFHFEKNNKKSPISNSINYECNKQKLNRINTFQTNKTIKDIKFSKSGKNLRYQNFLKAKLTNSENIIKKSSEVIREPKTFYIDINKLSPNNLKKSLNNTTFTSPQESVESYLYNNTSNDIDSFNILDNFRKSENYHKERLSLPFNTTFNTLSFLNLQGMLNEPIFNTKLIMEKEFNIFDLEKKVGHKNVLPIMGRTMLDSFGLIDEKIMPVDKLEPFLVSVANQYLTSTLYHNSLHGADITQTICLFFNNSNAEEVCHTQAIDLLSIIIAALGHDIGHPGLTNTFQINSSSEIAITYNDSSCLENFHLAKLFTTIRKNETNIFEKLSSQDYKKIRKRMISEILATDMAIHGKVLNNIRSKIPDYLLQERNDKEENNNNIKKFELISDINNEETTNEEKQALFDYFIHSADLGHNTKIFDISLKWVELLSNEFWLQGDKERKMNLNISFLCDRDTTNVPKSQVGFIGGFIIPTYNYLVVMFPTLSYTIENAKNNLNRWQKLADEGRKKGWTPEKKKENKNSKDKQNISKKKEKNHKDILKRRANVVEIKID
jgi:hypothetical protein